MNPDDIRVAELREAAKFLDGGRNVDQGHLRNALANVLKHVADLQDRVKSLEKRVLGKDATDELE